MIASTIKDLHYERYLKIVPKLHEPLSECNLAQFSNITSSVNPSLYEQCHMITCLLYTLQNYVCQPLPKRKQLGTSRDFKLILSQ